jgi:hypothetical protein
MKLSSRQLLVCVPMATLVLLGACSSESEPEAAAPAKATATKPALAAAPKDETANFAKAVGDGKPGAAVNIRYEFSGKPNVGVPTELDVVFVPSAGVDSMDATLGGMDGITLAGTLIANFAPVEAGKAYHHKVSVLPDRTGVFYVTVSVNTQIAGSALNRTFSIPFVVGQVAVQQKPTPPKDDKGESVKSMPAQEGTQPKQ